MVLPQKVFDELHVSNKKGDNSGKNIIVVVVFDPVVNEGKKTKKGNGKGHKRSSCIETHFFQDSEVKNKTIKCYILFI